MIKVEEALNIILSNIEKLIPEEEVILTEARGRILRENIISDMDLPPFDNSAMDGYAVRSEDIKNAALNNPISLKVLEEIPAGVLPQKKVGNGEASLIMTGAVIPEGADCVVIVEHTEETGNTNYTKTFFPGKKGDNIRLKGEDIKKGEVVLEPGIILKPSDIGLLAALGKTKVLVSKKPTVAILASGDELVSIDSPLPYGKIRGSNSYMLGSLVANYGGIPLILGIANDTKDDLVAYFNKAKNADIIITTGGVSVGKYDVVKDTLKSLGSKFIFWRIAMKPGKPLAFCIWENKFVFGLPGNPISSYVCFEQFIRPSIWKLLGKKKYSTPPLIATLESDINKKTGIKYFARCKIYIKNGELVAEVQCPHGSNMLKPLTRTNGFAVLHEDNAGAKKGDKVEVQLIDALY